jgi:hypothetical protein
MPVINKTPIVSARVALATLAKTQEERMQLAKTKLDGKVADWSKFEERIAGTINGSVHESISRGMKSGEIEVSAQHPIRDTLGTHGYMRMKDDTLVDVVAYLAESMRAAGYEVSAPKDEWSLNGPKTFVLAFSFEDPKS